MIVLGGSSMHKGRQWLDGLAGDRLPAGAHRQRGHPLAAVSACATAARRTDGLASIIAPECAAPGTALPNQMATFIDALGDGRLENLLLMGTNMLSSFADANRVARGSHKQRWW